MKGNKQDNEYMRKFANRPSRPNNRTQYHKVIKLNIKSMCDKRIYQDARDVKWGDVIPSPIQSNVLG